VGWKRLGEADALLDGGHEIDDPEGLEKVEIHQKKDRTAGGPPYTYRPVHCRDKGEAPAMPDAQ